MARRVFPRGAELHVPLAFALNTGAYTTEILAGAIRTMPAGEIEAARSLGFDGWKLYVHLIMPSALRRALPYYSNRC